MLFVATTLSIPFSVVSQSMNSHWLTMLGGLVITVFVPDRDKQEELWNNVREFLGDAPATARAPQRATQETTPAMNRISEIGTASGTASAIYGRFAHSRNDRINFTSTAPFPLRMTTR